MDSFVIEGTLGAILHNCGAISEKNIEAALVEQKRTGLRFGEALVSLGIVTEEDIDWALSNQLDIPYVRINKETVDQAALDTVPASVARRFDLLPIIRIGDELRIAMADPLNKEAIAEVERVSACTVTVSMGLLREIREMQNYYYGGLEVVKSLGFSSRCFSTAILKEINDDAKGSKLLDYLLLLLFQKGLSSLIFRPREINVRVAAKQGAAYREIGSLPLEQYGAFVSRIRAKAGMGITDRLTSTLLFRFSVKGIKVLFRGTFTRAGSGECLSIQPAVHTSLPDSISSFAASDHTKQVLGGFSAFSSGLIIFSSVDAGDRTRLMRACLRESDSSGSDILAVGSGFTFGAGSFPVLPVDPLHGDFAGAVRAASLHRPSILAAEELANLPSLAAAIQSAAEGQLLFGGILAGGVRQVLRLVFSLKDSLPMLPFFLKGIACCRQAHILCPNCREEDSAATRCFIPPRGGARSSYFRGNGCASCGYAGFAGIRFLVEAVAFDDSLIAAMENSATSREVVRHLGETGFHGIVEQAGEMLESGDITPEQFLSLTME